MIPFALMLLFLNGCVTKIDIDYDAMDQPAPVAGANGVTIDLDTGGDARTGWKTGGMVSSKVKMNPPPHEALFGALRTELTNRGFTIGKSPSSVAMLARVSTLRSHVSRRSGLFSSNSAAGIKVRVLGPGEQIYHNEEYYVSESFSNKLFLMIGPTVSEKIPAMFTRAVHKAMADEKLFAAILKAHADAAAQSAVSPAMPRRMHQTALSRF
jgi:hypothetical protein